MTEKQKKYIRDMRIEGHGYGKIANALFLSPNAVKDYCKRNGLSGFGKLVKLNVDIDIQNKKVCKCCGKRLKHIKGKKKKTFCSDYCRKEYWRSTHD